MLGKERTASYAGSQEGRGGGGGGKGNSHIKRTAVLVVDFQKSVSWAVPCG